MSDLTLYDSGFDEFTNLMEKFSKDASEDNVIEVLKTGADEFIDDLSKLPKPRSQIEKSGYTHLIDTFSERQNGKELEIGWGKYYGPMVENGTTKMSGTEHLRHTWESNKDKYYKTMQENLFN